MRLLVVTQAIDTDDPVLAFFERWVCALSLKTDSIEVICLKEGKHALPENVRVHSLGKERGVRSKLVYAVRFFKLLWRLRKNYDRVFVHMNEEYLLLAGWWWTITGVRTVFWRNHKVGTWKTRLATWFSDAVCYTSPEAYVARFSKAVQMPIGIDTSVFTPPKAQPSPNSVLFLGRIDAVKRVEVFLEALKHLKTPYAARLYGSPTEADSLYAKRIIEQARPLAEKGVLTLHPGIPHGETPALYRSHAVYVNLTPSGSFDKTIGEAMASGCLVVSVNKAVRDVVQPELMVGNVPSEVARAISFAFALPPEERLKETRALRAYIKQSHSLEALMRKLQTLLEAA